LIAGHFRGFGGRKLTREAAMILFIPIVASVLTITSVDYLMMFWLPFSNGPAFDICGSDWKSY
jgi:hypothetical protein